MTPVGTLISAPIAIVVWGYVYHRRRRSERKALLELGRQDLELPYGKRLAEKLSAWEIKLKTYSHDPAVRLLLILSKTTQLYTLRSQTHPIVAITSGLWQQSYNEPDLLNAALAHEAGHIVARDVERLLRLRGFVVATIVSGAVVFVGVLSYSQVQGLPLVDGMFAFGLASLLGPIVAWSALLHARELHADAYAVIALGGETSIRGLLARQLNGRNRRSPEPLLRRAFRWTEQPELRWRAKLPFVDGRLGVAITLMFGVAAACFFFDFFFVDNILIQKAIAHGDRPHSAIAWAYAVSFWALYSFSWGRSRTSLGAVKTALLRTWSDILIFVSPSALLALLVPQVPLWPFVDLVAFVWAAGCVSLLSQSEQRRDEPSLLGALVGSIVVLILGAALMILLANGLPHSVRVAVGIGPALIVVTLAIGAFVKFLGSLRDRRYPLRRNVDQVTATSHETDAMSAATSDGQWVRCSIGFDIREGVPWLRVKLYNDTDHTLAADAVRLTLMKPIRKSVSDDPGQMSSRDYASLINDNDGGNFQLLIPDGQTPLYIQSMSFDFDFVRVDKSRGALPPKQTATWEVANEPTVGLPRLLGHYLDGSWYKLDADGDFVVAISSASGAQIAFGGDQVRSAVAEWRTRLLTLLSEVLGGGGGG